ncbi:Tm-1-like ATP-binding domain-containing protein [Pseudonocardia kujensis]|uniref:Tm-1-like ATP-binding domain-containing protein n=1 Tax=Pseudonocardia kujensis TaxID=1128675 RepID=UPI001E2EF3D1|nr:Tm-1-like ATP-binding domain-containing protein [Pseudonocardia kujensis]MCE0763606.1 Tm-1-like ATP-binding domain-containing protein [Pseudonocardia kujensis]
MSTVALLTALDTKAADAAYLRDRLHAAGHRVLLVDVGVLGEPGVVPDVTRDAVARAAGTDIVTLRAQADRGHAVAMMAAGATAVVHDLSDRVDGFMAIGGGAGTTIGCAALRELPLGVPKVVLTTVAAGDTAGYLGTSDIVLFPSVVDVAGVNRISARTYALAADALSGMVTGLARPTPVVEDRPVVAASMFGVTTPCVTRALEQLERAGCEVLVFHATGAGGRTMARLVAEGRVDAVLDLTTTEWADEIAGGILSAGPDRLTSVDVPQVVSLGATDMVNFGSPETLPTRYAGRLLYRHNPQNTLMRVSPEEAKRIGAALGAALASATGPTVLLVPLRGVSALDAPGAAFEDPVARTALVDAVRARLHGSAVRVEDHDLHLNDPAFADLAASRVLQLLEETTMTHTIEKARS